MKKSLVAVALVAASGVANAGLSFSVSSTPAITETFSIASFTAAQNAAVNAPGVMQVGTLNLSSPKAVTFTYLGSESGFDNIFYNFYVSGSKLFENVDLQAPVGPTNPVGTSVSANVWTAGALDFGFEGATGSFAYNDQANRGAWCSTCSIGLIGTNMTVGSNTYAYVIGYNDSAGSGHPQSLSDWDDMVIGVNIAPIPEPETYAMMLAGLGLMGFVARRRKQKASA